MNNSPYLLDLTEVDLSMIHLVGGKNASLGEMIQNLAARNILVPGGFVITVAAFNAYIQHNQLREKIDQLLEGIDTSDIIKLRKTGAAIRRLVADGVFPSELVQEITDRYYELSSRYDNEATDVAVRSSATAEDLPDASFAGQQETFLNVRGAQGLLNAVKSCFASLYNDRAISYRAERGFDHAAVQLSVGVQKMVRSDLGVSGVAFSIDTESGFKDAVVINGAYGLGELLVQGEISPDEFIVYKPNLRNPALRPIIEKKMGRKHHKLVYGTTPTELVKRVPVDQKLANNFCLHEDQILLLARWVAEIENYYTEKRGVPTPMDVEWAVDGLTKQLFIVQARPETVHSQREEDVLVEYHFDEKLSASKLIMEGIAVGDGIGFGKVHKLYSLDGRDGSVDEAAFKEGSVLVTEMTDPDWEPIMKKASAIVTDKGGRTCHAAIVAREMGIPAIVGTGNASLVLQDDDEITVSCADGETGKVYKGQIEFEEIQTNLKDLPTTQTPLMMNVASPDMAFKFSKIPNSGVGLVREEFIINNYIKVHPLALLKHREVGDEVLSKKIEHITSGFDSESDFFIKKLSYGIGRIAAAFYPKDVIVRFSDFKSNEYMNLLGGKYFEPEEENPMIGWRGAARYYSDAFREAFGLECQAIKKVREEAGLDNVIVMIPFCRTPAEMKRVLDTMASFGLVRGENGLKVFLMAELPSNVMLAEEFSEHIDGFSIGSNDLTQLTLGLDRDSSLVAHLYDERNEAVKMMIRILIQKAKSKKVKVGICGQGPSDFPDFAAFLIEEGIDTISVTPDSMLKTLRAVSALEQEKNS
ncbi:phosphoenolpyruvate synthase [Mongoliitalea daihaiensis]|uniref:phosphoenolpyruvate synthase n=1 Tax=Mongoliitalea daihaiensis TaxID=2782006 RepID=UPI001F2DF381|nr:phosphoenolpyruvate synthase [Mongoliitalea daihaiensis]UJP65056.1 phosphoenolpyruvate synthase [Mongoliitalea daihaiensis]